MKDIYSHKHIVFGSDHYTTLGAIRSLGKVGINPDIILHPAYSNEPILCPNSKYKGDLFVVSSVEEGYRILIDKYGNESDKPFVYSCDDFQESYLDLHYDELISKFYFFNGIQRGIITQYMNKEMISSLAQKCGANIPKSEIVKKGELPTTLKYPIITKSLKSIEGAWKKDSRICYSEEQLMEEYKTIVSEVLLVEEFIEKKNELCLDGVSINGGEDVYLPFQTTYDRLTPTGYSNYMTVAPFSNNAVKDQVQKIMKEVGFNGVFSVEYLIDKYDDLYFLEVNFRNSTWSYAYTIGGVNLLYLWANGMLTGSIDKNKVNPSKKSFKAVAEFRHFAQFVRTGEISLLKYFRDVLSSKCLYYWSWDDPMPVIKYLSSRLKARLKG